MKGITGEKNLAQWGEEMAKVEAPSLPQVDAPGWNISSTETVEKDYKDRKDTIEKGYKEALDEVQERLKVAREYSQKEPGHAFSDAQLVALASGEKKVLTAEYRKILKNLEQGRREALERVRAHEEAIKAVKSVPVQNIAPQQRPSVTSPPSYAPRLAPQMGPPPLPPEPTLGPPPPPMPEEQAYGGMEPWMVELALRTPTPTPGGGGGGYAPSAPAAPATSPLVPSIGPDVATLGRRFPVLNLRLPLAGGFPRR